jgi:twinkle protein
MDVLQETKSVDWLRGDRIAIPSRGLSQKTCEKWNYEVSQEDKCHIANYRDAKGTLVAQKIRRAGKQFSIVGDGKKLPLYGQWLWGGGKRLIITEGEIDALSMSQAQNNKWPVVSLPNGAQSAAKALAANYDWLDNFETIILMFDQDDPGRQAVDDAAAILPLGKVRVAVLPYKDANETLLKAGPDALVSAQWDAKPWRPDGIINGTDITLEELKAAVSKGFELPYPALQEKTLGLRKGELTLLTAGSGIGKSTLARELGYWLHEFHGLSVGNIFLEEKQTKTAQAYVAIDANVPLGRLRHNPTLLSDEQWSASHKRVVQSGRMWFYDHFGSLDSSRLFTKLYYLAKACKVDFIMLDHISIVTSGLESSSEGERKDIDILMTKLVSFAQETGVGVVAIVHLKRVTGKSFNEGSQVSLNDLRGSAALEQLSDNVWALERDQQDETDSNLLTMRILKNRELGDLGEADVLAYNVTTGRLELPVVAQL